MFVLSILSPHKKKFEGVLESRIIEEIIGRGITINILKGRHVNISSSAGRKRWAAAATILKIRCFRLQLRHVNEAT